MKLAKLKQLSTDEAKGALIEMTNPPQPGNYIVTINDLTQEGSYGVLDKMAYWNGLRWLGLLSFEVVVGWRVM